MVLCNIVLLLHVNQIEKPKVSFWAHLYSVSITMLSFLSALPCRQEKSGAFMHVHQVTARLYLGCCLLWLPLEILISSLYDQAVDWDKRFSLFLLHDSDVTLWLQQHHIFFLYFAHNFMGFSACLKYHRTHEGMEGEKKNLSSNSFLCSLILIIICYGIYIWYFLWT